MFGEMTYTSFVNRYRDKSYIGSGGFAKVYKVFDFANGHFVALKIADVRPELNKFTLQNEVALVNQLPEHPNIVRYDACYRFNTGITGEMDFAVLPYYENGNLEKFLQENTLSDQEKKTLVRHILQGVAFLHRHNCIHRDLKAQNILIHRENGIWVPKIADFGLSRYVKGGDLSVSNSSIGITFAYAAPEQIRNQKIFKNVDLWALGVIVYHILSGALPFCDLGSEDNKDPQSQLEVSRRIINLELPDNLDSIAEPYQKIIRRCLVLDPTERAQSAEELLELLDGPNYHKQAFTPAPVVTPPVETPSISDFHQAPIPPASQTAPMPPELSVEDSNDKTEIIFDKTVVIPKPKVKEEPKDVFHYTPPVHFDIPEYSNPKTNVTQILSNKLKDTTAPPPPEPVHKIQMNDSAGNFNKLWIYLPLFLIILSAVIWGFYRFLNPPPVNTFPPPKEVLPKEPRKETLLPADFVSCFEKNKKRLGGVFRLTPTEALTSTFEKLDGPCYKKLCNTLTKVANGKMKAQTFYDRANSGDFCFGPVLKATLEYHHQQLSELPLLALFYNSGQSQLAIAQKNQLDGFFKKYKQNTRKYGLLIIGRASNVGSQAGNQKLSKSRAEKIVDFVEKHSIKSLKSEFVYFGSEPPQLDRRSADAYRIDEKYYKNISFGSGRDADFSLRLNQSVLLIMYSKKEDPFDLER